MSYILDIIGGVANMDSSFIAVENYGAFIKQLREFIKEHKTLNNVYELEQLLNKHEAQTNLSDPKMRQMLIRNIVRYVFMGMSCRGYTQPQIIELLTNNKILSHPSTISLQPSLQYEKSRMSLFRALEYFQMNTYADDDNEDEDDDNNDDNDKKETNTKIKEYGNEEFTFPITQAMQLGYIINLLIPLEDSATSAHVTSLLSEMNTDPLIYLHILAEYFEFQIEINDHIIKININNNNDDNDDH